MSDKKCLVPGCNKKAHGKYCYMHYARLHKHGDLHYGEEYKQLLHNHRSEYNIWQHMKQRCYNRKSPNYAHYGGKGIRVCKRWNDNGHTGFINFIKDMGRRPGKRFSLDRIDVNGNYCPENCRWTDPLTQALNKNKIPTGIRKSGKKWTARLRCDGKNLQRTFDNQADAVAQRKQWIKDYYNAFQKI